MDFEFDPGKSAKNKVKHGIDFVEAQELWQDPTAVQLPARSETEPREALIASYLAKLWTAIFTRRKGKIRITSCRRARNGEESIYNNS
ncbi:MAG: BrnT family toxin [Lentimonas sp.]